MRLLCGREPEEAKEDGEEGDAFGDTPAYGGASGLPAPQGTEHVLCRTAVIISCTELT